MIGHILSSKEAWPLRKGEATRTRILDEAARQAAARGLSAVSLAEVAQGVGLSKSGLFRHFDDKEAMQLAILEQVLDRFTRFTWAEVEGLPPGRPRLERIFDQWLAWTEHEWDQSGCPIMAASVELDAQPGPLRDYLQNGLRRWRMTLLAEFKALRSPSPTDDEAATAYFQMKSFVLGHAEALRLMADPDARASALSAFQALLDRSEGEQR